jgi:hypothetical protein
VSPEETCHRKSLRKMVIKPFPRRPAMTTSGSGRAC